MTNNKTTFLIVLTSQLAKEKLYLTGGCVGMETDDINEAHQFETRMDALAMLYKKDADGKWTTEINQRSFVGCGCAPHGDNFMPHIEVFNGDDAAKLLCITTDEELIAVGGSERHQAVKQRCEFLYQPGGYRDVLLDGVEIGEINDDVMTFHDVGSHTGALRSVADAMHNTKHESSRQACRRFMALVIHYHA